MNQEQRYFIWDDAKDRFVEVSQGVYLNEGLWKSSFINNKILARRDTGTESIWFYDFSLGNVSGMVVLAAVHVVADVQGSFMLPTAELKNLTVEK
jgi:hypothetical protein